jgi:hypothetical protein
MANSRLIIEIDNEIGLIKNKIIEVEEQIDLFVSSGINREGYLRKEKEQLRNEKEQLRNEKEQIREKENILLKLEGKSIFIF